jgi:predicted flap endonuclease-1-like 5' DNA nuclease
MDTELQAARLKAEKLLEKLDKWKQRVAPLAEKLREQQVQIRRLQADEKSTSESVDACSRSPDNLQKIRGIGPALERRLNNSGIHRYQQIAQMSEKELAKIAAELAISPSLAARDGWIKQACELLQQQSALAKRASE